jgi:hypothetical protein
MQSLVAMVAASGEITTLHTLDVPVDHPGQGPRTAAVVRDLAGQGVRRGGQTRAATVDDPVL